MKEHRGLLHLGVCAAVVALQLLKPWDFPTDFEFEELQGNASVAPSEGKAGGLCLRQLRSADDRLAYD